MGDRDVERVLKELRRQGEREASRRCLGRFLLGGLLLAGALLVVSAWLVHGVDPVRMKEEGAGDHVRLVAGIVGLGIGFVSLFGLAWKLNVYFREEA